ncbi:MAG: PAS domain S-box protein, partial [Planctomycetales bacterium]|nr:PAS domain S-box protein [Planctomycetales bacterium]
MSALIDEQPATLDNSLATLNSQLDELQRSPSALNRKIDCAIDWREVIDTSNDSFIATDASGVILEWNVKAEQLFGWTAEEAVGRQLVDTIFPPSEEAASTGGLKSLLSASSAGKRHELTARRKDLSEIPVEASVSMMRCGSSFVFNAFIHDITQRRQLQVQLTHAQKLESIGQLSAGIAHEINTPTQYVGDNTRFLQESLGDIFTALAAYEKL